MKVSLGQTKPTGRDRFAPPGATAEPPTRSDRPSLNVFSRSRLGLAGNHLDPALSNPAIDSAPRGRGMVKMKVGDVLGAGQIKGQACSDALRPA